MADELIDGKAIARAGARRGRRRGRRVGRGRARAARPGDDPGRRRSGVRGLRRRQAARRAPRSASAASTTGCRPTAAQAEVAACSTQLNADPGVSGILLQLPTPGAHRRPALTGLIAPDKDVDGLTPIAPGCWQGPPGPAAVHAARRAWSCCDATTSTWRAPRRSSSAAPSSSASRSPRCCCRPTRPSRPATRARATCAAVCRRADVLVAAVGRAAADHGRLGQARRGGDRRRHEPRRRRARRATSTSTRSPRSPRLITPVPGGVGPMTIAMLLRNTLAAARRAREAIAAAAPGAQG